MINFAAWLVVGGLVGWLAGVVMKTDVEPGIPSSIVVGIAGATIGGWLFGPLSGTIDPDTFSLSALLVSLLGSLILLAMVELCVAEPPARDR